MIFLSKCWRGGGSHHMAIPFEGLCVSLAAHSAAQPWFLPSLQPSPALMRFCKKYITGPDFCGFGCLTHPKISPPKFSSGQGFKTPGVVIIGEAWHFGNQSSSKYIFNYFYPHFAPFPWTETDFWKSPPPPVQLRGGKLEMEKVAAPLPFYENWSTPPGGRGGDPASAEGPYVFSLQKKPLLSQHIQRNIQWGNGQKNGRI